MLAPPGSPPTTEPPALAAWICELGLQASQEEDPGGIIEEIARVLLQHTGAAFVGVALRERHGDWVTLRWGASRAGVPCPRGVELPLGASLLGRALTSGQPASATAATDGFQPLAPGMRAALAAPLLVDDEVVAVLVAEGRDEALAPHLAETVTPLLRSVALAVRNVRALESGRHRVNQMAVLAQVGRIVTSTVDLDELLRRTVECIRAQRGYQLVALGLVDDDAQRVVMRATAATHLVAVEPGHSQKLGEGVTGEVAQTGRSLLVADVRDHPNYVPVAAQVRSEMCCPLRVGDRVIGCLNVESDQPGAFDAVDLELLETIADHIAQAVQNAQALRQVALLREELAGMLVHDLRHPLTVILASLDVLGGYLKRLDAAPGLTQLRDAQSACEEMLVQIGGLLDLQKLEAGAMQARPRPCAPGDVVRAVAGRLEIVGASRGVTLVATVADDLPAAWLDAELVTRVLENLVVNALKFTPATGCVEVAVAPASAQPGAPALPDGRPALLFSVRDTGPGIPAPDRERIFDRFVSGTSPSTGLGHSTGQGLAFCKRAVEAHGGLIWVDPDAASGSTFHLLLPLAPSAAAPATPTRPGQSGPLRSR